MKKVNYYITLSLFIGSILIGFKLDAQSLETQKAIDPPSLTKDSYCGSVDYDIKTQTTTLNYLEYSELTVKLKLKSYSFDKELNLVDETVKEYNWQELIGTFDWFNYQGESYTKDWVDVQQTMGGKIKVSKMHATYNYIWPIGDYVPQYDQPKSIKIQGEDQGNKVALYAHASNTETGETYLIVGHKAPKGSKEKQLHARKFQIVKVSQNMEVEYLEEFDFDYNVCINFSRIVPNDENLIDPDADNSEVPEISGAKYYMVFSPIKNGSKGNVNPDMGNSTIVVMDENGKIAKKLDFTAPTPGWAIRDMVKAPNANDYYFLGPAKDKAYANQVTSVISPLDNSEPSDDIKYKNYQIMKISDGELAWINSTPIDDFESKASAPPSQKGVPEYKGKRFKRQVAIVTNDGELFFGGQNYKSKTTKNEITQETTTEIKYTDLILAHFDNTGKLKRVYGVKRDKTNKYAKANPAPMDIFLGPDAQSLYWVYGEIKGMKKGFGSDELTISKRKMLYFPAVTKVDLSSASISDFTYLGADSEGKQKYYTNPAVKPIMSSDGKKLIFVGEDKPGKLVWVAKMALD